MNDVAALLADVQARVAAFNADMDARGIDTHVELSGLSLSFAIRPPVASAERPAGVSEHDVTPDGD